MELHILLLLDLSGIPANSVPGQFESTPNENEQPKLETGNDRSERMRRRFAAVSHARTPYAHSHVL